MSEGSSNGKFHPVESVSAGSTEPEPTQTPPPPTESEPGGYNCPSCGLLIPTPDSQHYFNAGPFVTCPNCCTEFVLPASTEAQPIPYESNASGEAPMDAMRVHELARVRRASIRSRSWLVVGGVGCVAVSGEFIQKTVEGYRVEKMLTGRSGAFIACSALAVVAAICLGRRAAAISRELARPLLEEPTTPPDFSTLSDGSQHWKNLDKM